MMDFNSKQILGSIIVGLWAGSVSGLLGVSSGGILVPALAIALGIEQHLAQVISLAAQVLPTSLPGVFVYQKKGHQISWTAVTLISMTFILGGYTGASFASQLSANTLRWSFVGYLLLLAGIITRKPSSKEKPNLHQVLTSRQIAIFLLIGLIAGMSSGLLGIGGGLAITALSIGILQISQHQAQAISLAVTMLPLTLPAVWVYHQKMDGLPWFMISAVVFGLIFGNILGAQFANRVRADRLKHGFLVLILAMAACMAWKSI